MFAKVGNKTYLSKDQMFALERKNDNSNIILLD